MILDFSPRCKMLFTQISPDKRPHNLCKFLDILQTDPLYTAFPLYKRYPCGHKKNSTCCAHMLLVLERATRIELATSAWEADVLPLNYARICLSAVPTGGSACTLAEQKNGAGNVTWTRDLCITNALLYQLSYSSTGYTVRSLTQDYLFIIPQILDLSRGFKKILWKIKKTIEIAEKMCYNNEVL